MTASVELEVAVQEEQPAVGWYLTHFIPSELAKRNSNMNKPFDDMCLGTGITTSLHCLEAPH